MRLKWVRRLSKPPKCCQNNNNSLKKIFNILKFLQKIIIFRFLQEEFDFSISKVKFPDASIGRKRRGSWSGGEPARTENPTEAKPVVGGSRQYETKAVTDEIGKLEKSSGQNQETSQKRGRQKEKRASRKSKDGIALGHCHTLLESGSSKV